MTAVNKFELFCNLLNFSNILHLDIKIRPNHVAAM